MQEAMSENAVERLTSEIQAETEAGIGEESGAESGAETEAGAAERAGESDARAGRPSDPRVEDLERRIRELEAAMGDLRTVSASGELRGRRTQGHASRLLAKGGEPVAAGSVDAALLGLSPEQRMSVKSGLLRAGLL